jgi:hypothetical protein
MLVTEIARRRYTEPDILTNSDIGNEMKPETEVAFIRKITFLLFGLVCLT